MRSLDIKNLSISLEALSRIQGSKSEDVASCIWDLLTDLIKEEETKHSTRFKLTNTPDDEIPF